MIRGEKITSNRPTLTIARAALARSQKRLMSGKFLNQTERKTVETVFYQGSLLHTRLKPGVNEQVALVLLGQGKAQESPRITHSVKVVVFDPG